jgi:hypothetical protein
VIRPPHPENLAAGQPSTSHPPISRFTPQIAAKLRGKLGYLLGNLSLKGIEPKCPQSKGIVDLGPLVNNSSNSKNHQIETDSRRFLGQSHQPKRHKVLIRDTQQEYYKKSPSKLRQENHKQEHRKSTKGKTGEITQGLEEPRRIIYTYHEGSYKV